MIEKSPNYWLKCKESCSMWGTCTRRSLNLDMPKDMLVENCRNFREKEKDE